MSDRSSPVSSQPVDQMPWAGWLNPVSVFRAGSAWGDCCSLGLFILDPELKDSKVPRGTLPGDGVSAGGPGAETNAFEGLWWAESCPAKMYCSLSPCPRLTSEYNLIWKCGLCSCSHIGVTSSQKNVGPNPMSGVLTKRKKLGHRCLGRRSWWWRQKVEIC